MPNGWVFVYEPSGLGFESSCHHLNFRFCVCFERGVPWHSGNFRVWIQCETRTWHDKNIQSKDCKFKIRRFPTSLFCQCVKLNFCWTNQDSVSSCFFKHGSILYVYREWHGVWSCHAVTIFLQKSKGQVSNRGISWFLV